VIAKCGEGGRSYLGRSPACPGSRTERVARLVITAEKLAEGIVGRRAPKARTVEWQVERISHGPCGRKLSWSSYTPEIEPQRPHRLAGHAFRSPREGVVLNTCKRCLHDRNEEGVVGGYYFQLSPMTEGLADVPQSPIRCILQRVEGAGVGFYRVHAKSSNGGLS
jgi:hypothetical protein